ncbi:hypothetical protein FDC04_17925 [Clostridium botulinum]|nr:hypothetical protein [Clostridium botulinum]
MSKLEEAYSIEYNRVINAEKAYELFWDGTISDKRAFECTDPNCDAQITCVNIDKKRAEMKQRAHFKCYGEHNNKCNVIKEFNEIQENKDKKEKINSMNYIDDTIDIFSFNRPKKDGIIVKTNEAIDKGNKKKEKERIKKEYKSNGSRNVAYYSVKPLISKFEKYSSENTLDKHFINIKGFNVSYKRMFVSIKDIDIENVEKYFRIYYGIGRINKVKKKDKDFIIFFSKGFGDKGIKTAIYVSSKVIDQHYRKNKWREELEGLTKIKDKKIMFFINSKPKKEGEMIYLSMWNMDFIDYRIVNE